MQRFCLILITNIGKYFHLAFSVSIFIPFVFMSPSEVAAVVRLYTVGVQI